MSQPDATVQMAALEELRGKYVADKKILDQAEDALRTQKASARDAV